MIRWLVIAAIAIGAWQWWGHHDIKHPPGVLAAEVPEQSDISSGGPQFEKKGYTITALANFSVSARVLGIEHYQFDRESDLAPRDFVLGWGPMSDSNVLARISISQGSRFYFWHVEQFPIPRRDIETNSANMHLIPATDDVEKQLSRAHVGNLLHFSGYLVEARAADGWRWRSSLTRDDTGADACELVWVESAEVQ